MVAARLQDVQDYRSAELHVPELFRPVQKEAINAMGAKLLRQEDPRIRESEVHNLTRISFYQPCFFRSRPGARSITRVMSREALAERHPEAFAITQNSKARSATQ